MPKQANFPMPAPPPVVAASASYVAADTSVMPTKRPVLQRQITKEDFDLDVNNIGAELESLKDILSGQISIDTSMVSSLFDAENEAIPTL